MLTLALVTLLAAVPVTRGPLVGTGLVALVVATIGPLVAGPLPSRVTRLLAVVSLPVP